LTADYADANPPYELFGAGTGAAQWTDYLSVGNARVGGIVRTDDSRNLITLSGNRQDIASMMEAI
jgi:hypothetical protein